MMHDTPPIRLGTRGSELAMWQAETVRDYLSRQAPMRDVEICIIKTEGDRVQDRPIADIGNTGVFTAELDRALLAEEIDLAVHSLKDLETHEVAGIELAGVLPRGPVEDCLVAQSNLADLKDGARVGTSSPRRAAQLRRLRPDLKVEAVRGNVPTRIEKLDSGEYDGLIMARAGLVRLGLAHRITTIFEPQEMAPAVGQGAVALVARSADEGMMAICQGINHAPTWRVIQAERALLRALGGGCQMAVGVNSNLVGENLSLEALVLSHDGKKVIQATREVGPEIEPQKLGCELAELLVAQGADELLKNP